MGRRGDDEVVDTGNGQHPHCFTEHSVAVSELPMTAGSHGDLLLPASQGSSAPRLTELDSDQGPNSELLQVTSKHIRYLFVAEMRPALCISTMEGKRLSKPAHRVCG